MLSQFGGSRVGKHRRWDKFRTNSRNLIARAITALLLISLFAHQPNLLAQQQPPQKQTEKPFTLSSAAFESDDAIPAKFTCSGANVSPVLTWTDPPAGTQSFALIVDDPDAPQPTPVVHWLMYAIPSPTRALPEGMPKKSNLPNGTRQGKNFEGKTVYRGPCPAPGKVHHYFFKLYALDYIPDLKAKATVKDLESAMKDHVLAKAELIGRFQRE
jgi:Raf kinase inhibitor-like YbhB/YbcL family protein